MTARLHESRPGHGCQRGFTLIEMLISITIGLGILAGLVGVLASNAGNSRSNDRTSELMTNGRYALNSIKQELREAGFRGYTWAEPGTPEPWAVPSNADGCFGTEAGASYGAFLSNMRQGVWGANNANPFAANCIAAASYANGNDVLVVRRLSDTPVAALAADTVYFRTTYERGQLFRAAGAVPVAPDYGASRPVANFALQTYVYYISPFTVSAAEVPLVPALVRVSLLPNGTMARELVASGIERMQVQYGRRTTAPDTQYVDVLPGASSDATDTTWTEVNSVRIWLLARSYTPEPGYVNTQTYTMGDQNLVANDGFRRQLFSTVVQLRN
jgi:type IV pilus assembly protein PilW